MFETDYGLKKGKKYGEQFLSWCVVAFFASLGERYGHELSSAKAKENHDEDIHETGMRVKDALDELAPSAAKVVRVQGKEER